ncbi:MAG: hypothetical protein HQK83_18555, partial [Fibrobacteria bacterium]|nr:hypothetical protein [Fibrobacteria bacterium]
MFALLISAFCTSSWAITGLNSDFSLNKEEIKNHYFEGEFDTVRTALEHFRKNMKGASRVDSVFVYKYLAVICAAYPESKLEAESYMYQLLKLSPSVELLDMYISDTIQAIFSKVRTEYKVR